MVYDGVSCKRTPSRQTFSHSPNRASAASQWKSASLPASQSREKIAPTSPSFSISSALFPKIAQLLENTRQTLLRNPFRFYQFRTPLHSFPGSPLFSVCSPKHTGGMGCRLLIEHPNRDQRFK